MLFSLLTSAVLMIFQTGEAYYNLDVTTVKYNNTELSILENEQVNARTSPNTERLIVYVVDTVRNNR
jgi:hypothetical protein